VFQSSIAFAMASGCKNKAGSLLSRSFRDAAESPEMMLNVSNGSVDFRRLLDLEPLLSALALRLSESSCAGFFCMRSMAKKTGLLSSFADLP